MLFVVLRFTKTLIITSLLLGLIYSPPIKAETLPESRIVISELQTESASSALDDFVELTNRSEDNVDVTGWEIQTKATGATSEWIERIVLNGTIYAGGSIILSYSDAIHPYLTDIASGHFTTGLSTNGGHIRLFDTNLVVEEDKLGWGTASNAELLPAPKPLKPNSLNRKIIEGALVDTNNNLADFELGVPSPRAENVAPGPAEEPPLEEEPEVPPEEELAEEPEEEPPEVTPEELPPSEEPVTESIEAVFALPALPLRINEILPDPVAPQTDAEDEWIEIYNPNEEEVSLKDYKLQTGSSFSYSHTFAEVIIPAGDYISVSSGGTSLVLSNSGGAVRLLDPLGGVMDILASYPDVEAGEAYAFDGSGWGWTTTPTRDAENVITQPIIEPKVIKAAVKSVKKATSAKKATTVKKASTTKKKTTATSKSKKSVAVRQVFEDPAAISTEPPLHPSVLAGTGVLAILYGGYEYREDFSNKLFRLKRYLRFRRMRRR